MNPLETLNKKHAEQEHMKGNLHDINENRCIFLKEGGSLRFQEMGGSAHA